MAMIYVKERKDEKLHLSFRYDNGRVISKIMPLDAAFKASKGYELGGEDAQLRQMRRQVKLRKEQSKADRKISHTRGVA